VTRFVVALLVALTSPVLAFGQEAAPPFPVPSPASTPASVAEPSGQPAPAGWPAEPPATRHVSLALSPVHLLIGMVEVTGEVRLTERVSVALIGGLGRMQGVYAGCPTLLCTVTVRVYEVGAQGRWYLGNFDRGLHLGVEASYLKVDATDATIDVKATVEGLTVGPFVGWKWVGSAGFTFDLQGGLQLLVLPASSSGTSSKKETSALPLLNANLGWSF
jgi:hypothetical protein